jgi:hypothetical protein
MTRQSWRVARSLDVFLAQLNAARPQRSKASDGSIGDANHQNRNSDHNPWYGPGIVTARDFTHDPASGVDIADVTAELAATRDPRIKYVIANDRIIDSRPGNNPWTWMAYHGPNPHRLHFHLSVVATPACDDQRPWDVSMFGRAPSPHSTPSGVLTRGSAGPAVRELQRCLNHRYPAYTHLTEDGEYGPATEAAVREFQRRSGLPADGVAGPATLAALGLVSV